MVVRGIFGFVFGIVTIFWPRDSVNPTALSLRTEVVDLIIVVFLAVNALLCVWQALSRQHPGSTRTVVLGQAVIAIPAIVFLLIAETPPQLRAAVMIWALLYGAGELWIWWQIRADYAGAGDFLISGAVFVIVALALFIGSTMQSLSILGFTGAAALLSGVVYVLGGITAAKRSKNLAAEEPQRAAPAS